MLRKIPGRLRKLFLLGIGSVIGLTSTGIGFYAVYNPSYTLPERPKFPLPVTTYHLAEDPENCLFCHEKSGPKPYPADHSWSNNVACTVCHNAAPAPQPLKASALSVSNKFTPHDIEGLSDCLLCHDSSGVKPIDNQHPWSTAETCTVCHRPEPLKLPAPKATSVPDSFSPVRHPVNGLEDCVLCHGNEAVKPVNSKHPWSPNETCTACHQTNAAPLPAPSPVTSTAKPVSHSVGGLENCRLCHSQLASRPFPVNHSQIPDNFCQLCHQVSPVPVVAPAPVIAIPISHPLNGLPGCLSCHTTAGPAPFPASHAGRPSSMCMICHQPVVRQALVVSTGSAINITQSTAILTGSLTSLGSVSTVAASFQWGNVPGGPYPSETAAITLNSAGAFQSGVGNLTPGVTYYFRAKAIGIDPSYGVENSFTTLPPVVATTVTTSDAVSITNNTATLKGNLDSLGNVTTINVSFRWGTAAGGPYPNETAASAMNITGAFQFSLTGLNPVTTYYYRAKATGGGTVYGAEKSFTTAPLRLLPVITTGNASNITNTTATLKGSLDNLGSATSIVVSFQWGAVAGGPYPNETIPTNMGTTGFFQSNITGLSRGTTYYFRVKATGSSMVYGLEKSFTTPN